MSHFLDFPQALVTGVVILPGKETWCELIREGFAVAK